jgi:hypothetical protein
MERNRTTMNRRIKEEHVFIAALGTPPPEAPTVEERPFRAASSVHKDWALATVGIVNV